MRFTSVAAFGLLSLVSYISANPYFINTPKIPFNFDNHIVGDYFSEFIYANKQKRVVFEILVENVDMS